MVKVIDDIIIGDNLKELESSGEENAIYLGDDCITIIKFKERGICFASATLGTKDLIDFLKEKGEI